MAKDKNYNVSDKAKDLILHSESTPHLQKHKEAVLDHLARKAVRKEYDADKAKDFWLAHADVAAKDCCETHGEDGDVWHKMFPEGVRKEAASHFEEFHRDHLKHRFEEKKIHEGVVTESAFARLANKIKKKEGYSEKEARGAAYEIGKAKYGKKEMARKAAAGRRDESVQTYFSILEAALNGKPADLKKSFEEAIQPNILDRIETLKDELRQFVFKFTNGEDVTNEPVTESIVNEASRVLLANYAKGKRIANKHWWNFSKAHTGLEATVPHHQGDFAPSGETGTQD